MPQGELVVDQNLRDRHDAEAHDDHVGACHEQADDVQCATNATTGLVAGGAGSGHPGVLLNSL